MLIHVFMYVCMYVFTYLCMYVPRCHLFAQSPLQVFTFKRSPLSSTLLTIILPCDSVIPCHFVFLARSSREFRRHISDIALEIRTVLEGTLRS